MAYLVYGAVSILVEGITHLLELLLGDQAATTSIVTHADTR